MTSSSFSPYSTVLTAFLPWSRQELHVLHSIHCHRKAFTRTVNSGENFKQDGWPTEKGENCASKATPLLLMLTDSSQRDYFTNYVFPCRILVTQILLFLGASLLIYLWHKTNTLDSKWQAHIQRNTKINFHNWLEKHDETGHHYHIFNETSRSQTNYLLTQLPPSGSTRFNWTNRIICHRCILLTCMGQEQSLQRALLSHVLLPAAL